jgi:hypothetical protein
MALLKDYIRSRSHGKLCAHPRMQTLSVPPVAFKFLTLKVSVGNTVQAAHSRALKLSARVSGRAFESLGPLVNATCEAGIRGELAQEQFFYLSLLTYLHVPALTPVLYITTLYKYIPNPRTYHGSPITMSGSEARTAVEHYCACSSY